MNKTVIFLTFVFIYFQSFAQHEHHQTPKDTPINVNAILLMLNDKLLMLNC